MIAVKNINDYKKLIADHKECLVKIGAPWCNQCKIVSANIEDIQASHSDTCFIDVNADEVEDVVNMYNIRNIPVVLVIRNGEVVNRATGIQNQAQLEDMLCK